MGNNPYYHLAKYDQQPQRRMSSDVDDAFQAELECMKFQLFSAFLLGVIMATFDVQWDVLWTSRSKRVTHM